VHLVDKFLNRVNCIINQLVILHWIKKQENSWEKYKHFLSCALSDLQLSSYIVLVRHRTKRQLLHIIIKVGYILH